MYVNCGFFNNMQKCKWNTMKEDWLKAAKQMCRWTKHHETWWRNEKTKETTNEKKRHHKI